MLFNNLKVAYRALRKNKIYTVINLAGLTLGIAAALLIFRLVNFESSFNKNFTNYDRIVRVVSSQKTAEGEDHGVCIAVPAMDVVEDKVSQFKEMSRVRELWATLTIPNPNGGAPLKKLGMADEETAFFVEPAFFKIFDLTWLAGEAESALIDPGTIVLTKSWAEKCFDNWESAIGQSILLDNLYPVEVRGVVEDLPDNCDFPIPFFVSYPTVRANADAFFFDADSWGSCSSNNQVYALLHNTEQVAAANEVLAQVGAEEYQGRSGNREKFHHLQPLSELHYDDRYGHSGTHLVAKSRLKVLSAIGILILIMACFNFVNLATAQASLARERGWSA